MFEPNPQKPFAYLPRKLQKTTQPLNYRYSTFPANYVAMCTTCLQPYQKVPKRCELCKVTGITPLKKPPNSSDVRCISCERWLPCRKCRATHIKKLIAPWILLPPELPSTYGFKGYLAINTPFSCYLCGLRYLSLAIYATLCNCKEHSVKTARFVCRYCCPSVDPKLIKAIERARKYKKDKQKAVPGSEWLQGQIFRMTLNHRGHMFPNPFLDNAGAPVPIYTLPDDYDDEDVE